MIPSNIAPFRHITADLFIPVDGLTSLDDDHLLDLARRGSSDAYAELFERYRVPAHRLAAYFSNPVDAHDIVAETFAGVLHQLKRGGGPHTSFRAYLFTSVRREAGKRARHEKRVHPTSDLAAIDTSVPFGGHGSDSSERELVRAAFSALPKRWQLVLWHLDVDGRKPREVAALLDMTPNSVSALAYRARAGLRQAYLEQHVTVESSNISAECKDLRHHLVALVRGSNTNEEAARVDSHLADCLPCSDTFRELREVSQHLGATSLTVRLAS